MTVVQRGNREWAGLRVIEGGRERSDAPKLEGVLEAREDDALMLLAREGNGMAFDTLVRRHQGRMLRVARRYTGDDALASDVAQNAFIELFRTLPRYNPQGVFSSFLFRILINQCGMAYRRRRREVKLWSVPQEMARVQLPDEAILAKEQHRVLQRALGKLSPKLRSVILLRYTAEMSYADIALTLEIPLGTVKRRLFDGLRALRQELHRR